MDKVISCVLPGPSQWFFHFGEEIVIAWTQGKLRHLMVNNRIILEDNARNRTAAAVTDLLRLWQWEILEHPPYSPDMSSCDYHLFEKVKETLQVTRCNTKDELNRAVGRSIRNINKDERADGVRRLSDI